MTLPIAVISVDEAEDVLEGVPLAVQTVSEHRWYAKQLVVFEAPDGLRGFYYLNPASELQEDQDRFESDPVRVYRVAGTEVVKTTYAVIGVGS